MNKQCVGKYGYMSHIDSSSISNMYIVYEY